MQNLDFQLYETEILEKQAIPLPLGIGQISPGHILLFQDLLDLTSLGKLNFFGDLYQTQTNIYDGALIAKIVSR